MIPLPRAIQALILASTVFGVAFLYEVHPVLPAFVFESVVFGWALFVLDSALTFVRPRVSFYLGMVLAVIALVVTLTSPAHWALVTSGDVPAAATIVTGSVLEVALIVLVGLYLFSSPKEDPWAWPGSDESLNSGAGSD